MSKFSEDLAAMTAQGFRLNGNNIQFPVYHLDGVPIEDLNLTTRAMNGLKRAQIMTVEKILETDLGKMRNLGVKSIREIKNAVLNYSYEHMSEKQKKEFWDTVLK